MGTGYSAEVSSWIVENGLSAEECYNIRISPFALFPGPESHTLVSGCIMGVARKAKDPSACELLMPSEAGLICVEGARSDIPYACAINANGTVGGNGIYVPVQDCIIGAADVQQNPCCRVALVGTVQNDNDCSPLDGAARFFEECQYQLAFKNHDPSACEPIQNSTLKTACNIQAKALRQDPSICQGCTKPVENVEELLELQP